MPAPAPVKLSIAATNGKPRGGDRPWRKPASAVAAERTATKAALGAGGTDLRSVARVMELQERIDGSSAPMAPLQLAVTQLLQAATNASGADAVAAAREAAEAAAEAAGVPRRAASERMSPAHSLHKLQLLHEIMPRLWCGGWAALNNDCQELRSRGVTHVVSVVSADQRRLPPFVKGHYYARVDDRAEAAKEIATHFAPVADFIEAARSAGGTVFVHCGAGISRAPTVTTAYMMRKLGLPAADALKMVRAARPCVRPNVGFAEQLRAWESSCLPPKS